MKNLLSPAQQILNTITFPLRAFTLFHKDKFGLSCLATERFDAVARYISGTVLDIGCGYDNQFVNKYCDEGSIGIDLFKYDGLKDENIVKDFLHLPYEPDTFDTITFIANLNHCPKNQRDEELAEMYRVLKPKGKIIVTMGNPIAELLVHKVVYYQDKLFGTKNDMDTERGMEEGEEYFLLDGEIISRLKKAGFKNIKKHYIVSQWMLNHLFVSEK